MTDEDKPNIPWIPDWVAYYAKALVAGLATAALTLAGMVSGDDTITDVTFQQWLLVFGAFVAGLGITYITPNREPS